MGKYIGKILMLTGIIGIIFISGILVRNYINASCLGTKNGAVLNIGEQLKIVNDYTEATIVVNSVQRQVAMSTINGDVYFDKIELTINNVGQFDFNVLLNSFLTIDEDGKGTSRDSSCLTSLMGPLLYKQMTDAMDLTVPVGNKRTGYIYCPDDSNTAKQLKINSVTKAEASTGSLTATSSDTFFINLK